jgi:uncharacterized protein YceH (UPF0502 family)
MAPRLKQVANKQTGGAKVTNARSGKRPKNRDFHDAIAKIAELEARINALQQENAELKARVRELEAAAD